MIPRPTPKSDFCSHAAAIERWDNEGGASSQVQEQKRVEKVRGHRRGDGQGSAMNRIGKDSFTQIFSRLSTQRAKHAAARSE